MAIGDDALAAGFALVPSAGPGAEVKLGAQEINRTRDYVAQTRTLNPAIRPISGGGTGASTAAAARTNLNIRSGTAAASDAVGGATDGNIYFKII
jgi:hypothetical protein